MIGRGGRGSFPGAARALGLLALALVAAPAQRTGTNTDGARGSEAAAREPTGGPGIEAAPLGPGERARTRQAVVDTAVATLFGAVGLLSLAAGLRWRAGSGPWLVLGAALVQHSLNRLAASETLRAALGGPLPMWIWVQAVTSYLIAVPWALLLELMVGPGWKSTIRRTWQVFLVYGVAAILLDVTSGRPGRAGGATQTVLVAVGALVGLANLALGGARTSPELSVLRAGYLVFLAMVVHDGFVFLGFLPWPALSNPFGLLIFVGCLVYTVVSRTLRGQRQLQAIEHELGTARRIQGSLLPSAAPRLEGAEVAFRYVPAAAVAGDLFEFLDAAPRRTGILVADVCGHGVPAALIASMVKVAAAAQRPHADDPARVLAGIHLALAGELPSGQFVTAVYVHVDLDQARLRHASAGHPPTLVWRAADGTVAPAGGTGPLIMSLAPAEYPVTEVPLAAGDRVLLYTDGVVEAMRADGAMFGADRLSALVANVQGGPEALLSAVIEALAGFAGRRTEGFDDDCTLVALEVGS